MGGHTALRRAGPPARPYLDRLTSNAVAWGSYGAAVVKIELDGWNSFRRVESLQPHLRIVPDATWETVQKRFAGRVRATKGTVSSNRRSRSPIAAILRCECGGGIASWSSAPTKGDAKALRYTRLYCWRNKNRGPQVCGKSVMFRIEEIAKQLLAYVKEKLLDPVRVQKAELAALATPEPVRLLPTMSGETLRERLDHLWQDVSHPEIDTDQARLGLEQLFGEIIVTPLDGWEKGWLLKLRTRPWALVLPRDDAGIDAAAIEQTVALAASTLGFPATVAVWTWVRDMLPERARRG